MLTRLYIDNYKSFVNFELRLPQLSVLVGDNGAGKTNCFSVIRALRDFVVGDQDLNALFPRQTLTRWDTRTVQAFELTMEGNGGTYHYRLEVGHLVEKGERRVDLE